MKYLFLISSMVIFSNICIAEHHPTVKKSDYKLTYLEYVNQYGIDDTCIAIIDLFFDKRENSGVGKMSFLPLSTAITVIAPPIGLGLMAVSSPLFVSGLITNNRYSRKNLLKTLINYQSNNSLSKRCRKKVGELMHAQQEMYMEDLLEARYNSLK